MTQIVVLVVHVLCIAFRAGSRNITCIIHFLEKIINVLEMGVSCISRKYSQSPQIEQRCDFIRWKAEKHYQKAV